MTTPRGEVLMRSPFCKYRHWDSDIQLILPGLHSLCPMHVQLHKRLGFTASSGEEALGRKDSVGEFLEARKEGMRAQSGEEETPTSTATPDQRWA